MAGEWIKFESSLPEKPETLAITAAMGWTDPDLTVGKLMRVFRWFDQQTVDGNAARVTPALLDHVLGVTGLTMAVASVGWIVVTEAGLALQKFDRHNGESAKQRALTAKRVAKHKGNAKANAEGNADSVSLPLPKEEKSREEKKETNTAPSAFVLPDWIPSETWDAYCKVRAGKKAKNEPHALSLIVKDLEAFRAAGHNPVEVLNNSIKSGWAGVFEPKTKPSVVGVTVPSAPGRDPALIKLDQDAKVTKPPSLETLARLAELRKPKLEAHG